MIRSAMSDNDDDDDDDNNCFCVSCNIISVKFDITCPANVMLGIYKSNTPSFLSVVAGDAGANLVAFTGSNRSCPCEMNWYCSTTLVILLLSSTFAFRYPKIADCIIDNDSSGDSPDEIDETRIANKRFRTIVFAVLDSIPKVPMVVVRATRIKTSFLNTVQPPHASMWFIFDVVYLVWRL